MRTYTKNVCTITAYLIGVRKNLLEECYGKDNHELLQSLYEDKDATVMRYLCKLRTNLMQKFKETDYEMTHNLKNLDKLDWFDGDNIKQLEKWGYSIIKSNYRAERYMNDITKLIHDNVQKCERLYPDWVKWDYIKALFTVPKFTKPRVLIEEFEKYKGNINLYPFQMYINWKPEDVGSLLYTDGKFLKTIYAQNDDEFKDTHILKDANEETKNSIYEFIDSGDKVEIVVDCENSDVYKLYGVLKNLNQDELQKISKIVLYDDYHTNSGWDWLHKFTKIPVEHIEVERVNEQKSLVDIKMTAGVCKDYYQRFISSFIIVSSDSDFWGLISSLPTVNFLVMYETAKCGQAIKNALMERGIYSCTIDDVCTANTGEFKKAGVFNLLEQYLPDLPYVNAKEVVKNIYREARIEATEQEMQNFFNKYIKTLKLKIEDDGTVKIEIAK